MFQALSRLQKEVAQFNRLVAALGVREKLARVQGQPIPKATRERALDVLERVLPNAGHELKHGWIKHDYDLDPLRNHPRYQKILELIG